MEELIMPHDGADVSSAVVTKMASGFALLDEIMTFTWEVKKRGKCQV